MKFNLLGQRGTKGQINPDAPEAGPYIYDSPPGRGDNKGLVQTSFGTVGVADKKTHNKKLEKAGLEPIPSGSDLSSTSFAPREEVEAKQVLPPATNSEINNVNNMLDLAGLAFKKNISTTQKNKLIGLFGFDKESVDSLILAGDTADEINYIAQLNEEDAFIRNIVNNNIAIAKAEEEKRDTRSLVQKETDYIKQYVENKNKAIDPGDVNYTQQLNEEMEYITNFVNNTVKPKVTTKLTENKSEEEVVEEVSNETAVTTVTTTSTVSDTSGGMSGSEATGGSTIGGQIVGTPGATKLNQFNNIPEGAVLVQSDEDRLYLMYTVPGAGTMYKGLPIRMFYEVKSNDLYKAGILTVDAPYEINYFMTEEEIDDFIVAGNTAELPGNDPNTNQAPHPFLSFVDNLTTQAQIAPWLLDKQSISLLAEAALEGREVSEAEWRVTDWYQEHSEAEREWLRLYNADPSTATAQKNDYKIQVSRALQAAGVTGGFDSATGQEKAPPDALVSWIADKWVSGTWSESQTSEQIALFADPFRSGIRDTDFTTYLSTAGVDGLERTAEKEDRVRQLYTQYLGPVFGKLSDAEVSQKAGRLRNDTDYEAALIEQLKNNRLGLFPKYTNPELTYEDIVTPWRNLTTSVWGEAADETQSWWQDMVGTNDFTSGTATLRSKGLEMGNNQVTIEATEALQSALGDGSALQNLGANQ